METNPLPPTSTNAIENSAAPGKSRTKRIIFGCGCGCLIFVVLLVVLLVFGFKYFFGPGVQVPTENILSPTTTAFVHLDPSHDNRANEIIAGLIQTMADIDPEKIDPSLDRDVRDIVEQLHEADLSSVIDVTSFLPSSMTLAFSSDSDQVFGPDGSPNLRLVGALNLSAGSRFLRWLLEMSGEESGNQFEHGEHTIFSFADDQNASNEDLFFFGFQHDTMLFGNQLELLQQAFDLTDYEDTPGTPGQSPVLASFNELAPQYLISGAIESEQTFGRGALRGLAVSLGADEDVFAELGDDSWLDVAFSGLRLGAGLTGDSVTLSFDLLGLAPEDLEQVSTGLKQTAQRLGEELKTYDLELGHQVLEGTDSLVFKLWLPDFETWLNVKLKQAIEE